MPRSTKPPARKAPRARGSKPGAVAGGRLELPSRPGLPARSSIVEVLPLSVPVRARALVAAGTQYRILRTNEVDVYDPGATARGTAGPIAAAPAAPTGDQYQGTARKAAKLSIGKKPVEPFADLKDLMASLPAEAAMLKHVPPIKTTSTSGRVVEEQRRARVTVFLYAASREADNDFHLILGRDPHQTPPELYMTMELSGLPPASNPALKTLKAARDAYKAFFKTQLPGSTYDFYDPPIPVEIEGSLFFDMTHSTGGRPGPKSLKDHMPVIWEVHPISQITFKP